ncbi:hypothetical protein BP422_15405 [Brevibacillus formosus]|uniref:Uncharacterized protein n=1 Tax=Brevibacillus formosus TaxID=54913 RepID=A0A220MID0_9BACL|nr:hypothetical protein [Brevibacillus formosus]ASJ54834.1 hypothetical protein BP422_15405 [Brevibacillus formosus]
MSKGIRQKYQGVMRDLLQKHKGTGKRIELFTERGVYAMQGSNSFVIEIVDDSATVEVEGIGSTEELVATIQNAVQETLNRATGKV